jgi:hypothetical protein
MKCLQIGHDHFLYKLYLLSYPRQFSQPIRSL